MTQKRRSIPWQRILPLIGSPLMLWWVLRQLSYDELANAFSQFNWPVVVGLSCVFVLINYSADSIGLACLFHSSKNPFPLAVTMRGRGISYLFTVVNWGFGQVLLTWLIAKPLGLSIRGTVARLISMAFVDVNLLMSFGLIGALLTELPQVASLKWVCIAGLLGTMSLIAVIRLTGLGRQAESSESDLADVAKADAAKVDSAVDSEPAGWKQKFASSEFVSGMFQLIHRPWLETTGVVLSRMTDILAGVVYLKIGFWLCGFDFETVDVVAAVAVMALLEGLPISVAGLGTRETTMIVLLQPSDPALMVAFVLTWSATYLFGRSAIGAVLWCFGGLPRMSDTT